MSAKEFCHPRHLLILVTVPKLNVPRYSPVSFKLGKKYNFSVSSVFIPNLWLSSSPTETAAKLRLGRREYFSRV
jgi:hypothetical protein